MGRTFLWHCNADFKPAGISECILDSYWTEKSQVQERVICFSNLFFHFCTLLSCIFDLVLRRKKWLTPRLKSSDGAGKVWATLSNTVKGEKMKMRTIKAKKERHKLEVYIVLLPYQLHHKISFPYIWDRAGTSLNLFRLYRHRTEHISTEVIHFIISNFYMYLSM